MYFPLVLAALVIVSAAFLLRQFWNRALEDDMQPPEEILRPAADDASQDALKAA